MSLLLGPKCRLCRREGVKLFLKGQKCDSPKCPLGRRDYPPGIRSWRRGKFSDYALQLREKQKLKRFYGVREGQFRRSFKQAERQPGNTGVTLLVLLERRLDNVVFRAGFAASRPEARQLIAHGHVTVNGRKMDIPSYPVRAGDEIGTRDRKNSQSRISTRMDLIKNKPKPSWLQVFPEQLRAKVLALPTRDEVSLPVQEQLVVELCSR